MAKDKSRALGGVAVAASLVISLIVWPGSGGAATLSPSANVCQLISLEAAREIVGSRVKTAAGEADNGGASCLYELSPPDAVVTVSLLNTVLPAVETEESNAKEIPVPELGPQAFWSARYLALHLSAPNGQVIRISVDRHEGRWSGADLKALATAFAAQALQGFRTR